MTPGDPRIPPSAATAAAGVDHVRLSYLYLDAGDLDAYASLLDEAIQLAEPETPPACGRVEATRRAAREDGTHQLFKVVAEGDCVVAVGRYTAPAKAYDFADLFTLSPEALLLTRHRFYYLPPPS
ncbi:hypothetical protein [Actinosynnema sp. NPDC020468]|uniref:nuclear transport factor 2 family protein n=1 Tax=Actinosynnema sp. NPDC020468 TaxID=3154488 RepID=UPI00340110B0